ncbi:hypothetical protein AB0A77_28390 [Streptomyces varsoviensis]|uniref:hypothetical protein n=1 Tax=Streptomyces varsoviensis TaxID=67373 RepID=UPI0033FCF841
MSERVRVRVLLLIGAEAEIVADAPDATPPQRYPATVVAEEVGVAVRDLPGKVLTAAVGPDDRLSGFSLAE